jgi:hypothetical protein
VSAIAVVALVLGILLLVALALVPLILRARRVAAAVEAELPAGVKRKATVNGLGLQSRGRAQVRGNGSLVLTADELLFRQWVPDRETRIPLAAITSVGTEKSWLGKWVGQRLLCVRWRTPDGGEDAMAWAARDLEGWLAEIEAARPVRR